MVQKEALVKIRRAAALASVGLALAACTTGSSTPTIEKKASPESSREPGGPAATPPPLSLGTPGPTTQGAVTVRPSKAAFPVGERVSTIVGNGLDQAIYTEDQKTACSIVFLERWTDAAWEPVSGCGYERAAAIVRIGPREVVEAEIDPLSTHLGGMGHPAFAEGRYRLVFAWRPEPGPEGHTSATVTSEEFSVLP
jgi:hypothetical protein